MRERPMEDKPSLLEVALVLLFILLAMAFAGKVDYQDELERENRTLRAAATRCQMIQALRDETPTPASGGGMGRGETP